MCAVCKTLKIINRAYCAAGRSIGLLVGSNLFNGTVAQYCFYLRRFHLIARCVVGISREIAVLGGHIASVKFDTPKAFRGQAPCPRHPLAPAAYKSKRQRNSLFYTMLRNVKRDGGENAGSLFHWISEIGWPMHCATLYKVHATE